MTVFGRRRFILGATAAAWSAGIPAWAQDTAIVKTPPGAQTHTYAMPAGMPPLALDLYMPAEARRPAPVVVFAHGGGWTGGSRGGFLKPEHFTQMGIAIASIDYRLAPQGSFPGNLEDVRTAVRWLRKNAKSLGIDSQRVGLWGTSAGALLVSVAGLAPENLFKGTEYLDQSSAVKCVLDCYAPTALNLWEGQLVEEKAGLEPVLPAVAALRSPTGTPRAKPFTEVAETALVGAPFDKASPEKLKAINPATYASRKAPPFLIMHGLADFTVPHAQSVMFYEALAKADADVQLRLMHGLPHTFFSFAGVDEAAGPVRMSVRTHRPGKKEVESEETKGIFDVAGDFFQKHLL